MARRWALVVSALAAMTAGCGNGEATPTCPAGHEVAGVCAGVPLQALCAADTCTEGAPCSDVIQASTDAELQAALGTAKAGACISLSPGTYGATALPGGVSLLGRSPDDVHVAGLSVGAGTGAVIRGLEVTASGIDVAAMASVGISAVRVSHATGDGIRVGAGAGVKVDTSEISAPAGAGVRAVDAATIALTTTYITGAAGPALHAECTGGCACPAPWPIAVASSALRHNGIVGVSLVGVHATLTGVEITDNAVGSNFAPTGGVSASQCARLDATGVKILDNSSFGLLVDTSSATLGKSGADTGLEVSRNLIGIWIQGTGATTPQPVTLENCTLEENLGVGIGLAGEANGIIIHDSHVKGTALQALPSLNSDGVPLGSSDVGDGVSWLGGATASIDGLALSGNARASVLINGSVGAGSVVANVTLSGGDEQKGVVQQSFQMNGVAPMVGSGAPPIQTSATAQFSIPAAPSVPAAP